VKLIKKLRKGIDRLNNQRILLPIADGLPAAHQKRISKGKVADKLAYVLKTPRKISAFQAGIHDRRWGSDQKKADFRPGETVFRLMQDLYLDHLAVAGGEGANILRRVKRRALQGLRD
jgi:hypothetical protein